MNFSAQERQRVQDEFFMHRAIDLAKRGEIFVSPNPMVGAVFVKNRKIIAEAWHKKFGGPHAEILAILNAKRKDISLAKSTLYINLEPCIHDEKKTPPCLPQLLHIGISRIVIAMKDPNPAVKGRAVAALRKARIKTDIGCLEKEAYTLNKKFIHRMLTKMPFVAMKVAMSLDGKIATRTGHSKWITSPRARAYVRSLRDTYDAILVGSSTVLQDNPLLSGEKKESRRIILDSRLRISPNSLVCRDSNVLLVTSKKASRKKLAVFQKRGIPLKIFSTNISLPILLCFLGNQGINSILVEGGSKIFGSFLDEKLIDYFHWFIAPKILGGKNAVPAVGGEGIRQVTKALQLIDIQWKKIGPDFLIEGRVKQI